VNCQKRLPSQADNTVDDKVDIDGGDTLHRKELTVNIEPQPLSENSLKQAEERIEVYTVFAWIILWLDWLLLTRVKNG